ncbi:MAG: hypothetical protein AAFQ66_17185 [Pseudomonadota bacterium]
MNNPAPQDELGNVLRRLPGRLFAVMDGAHYEDLPGRLRAVRLEYFPLYIDEIDAPKLAAGPHLVVCRTGYAIEQVRDVSAGAPSLVWWAWPDAGSESDSQIYRHLRRLNLMDVPWNINTEVAGVSARQGEITSIGGLEPVLFRHADPEVVQALLQVLAPVQMSRFFGGALAVVAEPPSQGGVMKAVNPSPDAQVPFGRLRLSKPQYSRLLAAYGSAMRRRATLEFSSELSGRREDCEARIVDAVDRAESYGCATQTQVWDFIRLDLRYGWRFEQQPKYAGVLTVLKDFTVSADERLFRAWQEIGFAERHGEL